MRAIFQTLRQRKSLRQRDFLRQRNLLCAFLLCLMAITTARLAAQSGLVNQDFEQGEPGQLPTGWAFPAVSKEAGYDAKLTEDNPKSGKRCALLTGGPGSAQKGFGNLMQKIEAAPYRDKRIRFRAAVRTEVSEPGARAQLWFRVNQKNNQMGFFDNMDDRPIVASGWQYYEIIGDVDDKAESIYVGLLLMGKARAWIDDASFEVLGKVEAPVVESPRALTSRGTDNLIAFTKLLGYVRHFHPSDEAAAIDWTRFTIEGVRAIESATNAAELAQKLESLFKPIAPTVRVFPTGKRPQAPSELSPPAANAQTLKITRWHHLGFGTGTQQSIYRSQRIKEAAPAGQIPASFLDPREPFYADLAGGVSCLVPVALFADDKGTLPHASLTGTTSKASEQPAFRASGNDRATRLATIALAWNIFEHFYPYFDVVKTDWNRALRDALSAAATDPDERAFLKTLQLLVAQLKDGHGNAYGAGSMGFHSPPVLTGWVEDRLTVIHVDASGTGGLKPGDVILKVDGKPVAEMVSEKERLISGATPQWIRYRLMQAILLGAEGSELTLEAERPSGEKYTAKVTRSVGFEKFAQEDYLSESGLPKIHEVKPGIFYINIDRIKDEDFQKALPQLEQAKGIVFDLRGYPKVSPMIIAHLIDKPVTSARWNVPVITRPGREHMTYQFSNWPVAPKAPRLKAKVAFITDGRAISYAETFLGIIENYKIGEIVGGPTAGTNGNINPLLLPGGYRVVWTGMKVLKHDGSQHHGIGIKPTVPVSRTLRGVAEGRDELVERAVEIVSK